jgi:hypothetical protein
MKFIKNLKFFSIAAVLLVSGCVWITPDEIKEVYPESLNTIYTNLQARYQDSDTGVIIFTYNVEKNFSLKTLRQQILNKKYNQLPSFKAVTDEAAQGAATELILRQEVSSSGPGGFNEYRILYNKDKKLVTVMYANLDSKPERDNYEDFLEKQDAIHKQN